MRLNKFIAQHTGLSRRAVDKAIQQKRVYINGQVAELGQTVSDEDIVVLDGKTIALDFAAQTILFHKPAGYVCSRKGQGSKTIYDLLPEKYHSLKPIGRLDKDSSGLLLITNDGQFAHGLTHPSFEKEKIYEVKIDKPLSREHFKQITTSGVDVGGQYISRFQLAASSKQHVVSNREASSYYFLPATYYWRATLAEGKNRQIRRTFAALGYTVTALRRIKFGPYKLGSLKSGGLKTLP